MRKKKKIIIAITKALSNYTVICDLSLDRTFAVLFEFSLRMKNDSNHLSSGQFFFILEDLMRFMIVLDFFLLFSLSLSQFVCCTEHFTTFTSRLYWTLKKKAEIMKTHFMAQTNTSLLAQEVKGGGEQKMKII